MVFAIISATEVPAWAMFASIAGLASGGAWFARRTIKKRKPNAELERGTNFDDRVTVSYGGDSYALFRPGQGMRFLQVASTLGPVDFVFSSRFVDGWGPPEQGKGIVADVRFSSKQAPNIAALADLLRDFAAVFSFSANAWVGDLSPACWDHSGMVVRTLDVSLMRELDAGATLALFESLGAHPEADRFWEAIHSYRTALGFWTANQRHLALAHLHRGLLAVAEVFIRISCENHGVTKAGLAQKYQVAEERLLSYLIQAEFYCGDDVCFKAAEFASEAMTAGSNPASDDFLDLEDLHVSAARYLRNSILRVLDLKEPCRTHLLGDDYGLPSGLGERTGPIDIANHKRPGPQLVRPRFDEGYRSL